MFTYDQNAITKLCSLFVGNAVATLIVEYAFVFDIKDLGKKSFHILDRLFERLPKKDVEFYFSENLLFLLFDQKERHFFCWIYKWIKKFNIDVNQKDKNGQTLLFHAIQNNDYRTVETLLRSGILLNQPDNNGNLPEFFAVQRKNPLLASNMLNLRDANTKLSELLLTKNIPNIIEAVKAIDIIMSQIEKYVREWRTHIKVVQKYPSITLDSLECLVNWPVRLFFLFLGFCCFNFVFF